MTRRSCVHNAPSGVSLYTVQAPFHTYTSIRLSLFSARQQMERWGNGRARAYFEAEVPPSYSKPSDWSNVQQMTRWIKVRNTSGPQTSIQITRKAAHEASDVHFELPASARRNNWLLTRSWLTLEGARFLVAAGQV